MKLQFDTYEKNRYYCVNVWYASPKNFPYDLASREYLNEDQYQKITDWCKQTFGSLSQPHRVRRMSYADFWFSSKRDLDWFILHWSGINGEDI